MTKMKIGAACAKGGPVLNAGKGQQFGTPGVHGSGENDGAAQWYTEIPSDGTNKGKTRVPEDEISFKALVRVIHGFTIMVALSPPWLQRTNNCDFGCTVVLFTFLALKKLWGRLPRRWWVICVSLSLPLTLTLTLTLPLPLPLPLPLSLSLSFLISGTSSLMQVTAIGQIQLCCFIAIWWREGSSRKLLYVDTSWDIPVGLITCLALFTFCLTSSSIFSDELVDGENSHIRAFIIGILKKCVGAVVGTPDQLRRAFTSTG
jgi:hypothetical protein